MNYELIKVCGMRYADNIRAVEALGIDLMGFIFWPRSPRCVSERPAYLPTHCRRVGVFVDAGQDFVLRTARDYSLSHLQLHGHESPAYLRSLRHSLAGDDSPIVTPAASIIKAFSIATAADLAQTDHYAGLADLFLFDTKGASIGGNGHQFDWSVLDAYHGPTPFLLSGGIGPADTERLKAFHHPHCIGIDLNSRFETEPGRKDVAALSSLLSHTRTNK